MHSSANGLQMSFHFSAPASGIPVSMRLILPVIPCLHPSSFTQACYGVRLNTFEVQKKSKMPNAQSLQQLKHPSLMLHDRPNSNYPKWFHSGLSWSSELETLPELDVDEEEEESSMASFTLDFGQHTLQTCVKEVSSGI